MTEEKKRPGRPKRDSTPNRPARVPLNRQSAFDAPCDLDRNNFAYRWCKDDGVGSIQRYEAAYWEKVTDESGNAYTRPAGDGFLHFLMKLPMEYHLEDQKLQESRNIDTLRSQTTVEEGDYIPNDRKFVVQEGI